MLRCNFKVHQVCTGIKHRRPDPVNGNGADSGGRKTMFNPVGMNDAMYNKMMGSIRNLKIPFHFVHAVNVNKVIEIMYESAC